MAESRYRQEITDGHNDLMAAIEGLPEAAFYDPPVYEDSGWTLADILCHLVTWQEAMLDALDCLVADRKPFILSHVIHMGVDAFNAHKVAANKGRSLNAIMIDLGQRYREVLRTVSLFSQEELETPGYWHWLGEKVTLIQLIADNDWEHKHEHAQEIRAWRERHGLGSVPAERPASNNLMGEFSLALVRYEDAHRRFVNLAAALPPEHHNRELADNDWTCRDVVVYLGVWVEEMRRSYEAGQPMVLADYDRDSFKRAALEAHRETPWADALITLQDTHARLVTVAEGLSPEVVEHDPHYLQGIDELSAELGVYVGQLCAWVGAL